MIIGCPDDWMSQSGPRGAGGCLRFNWPRMLRIQGWGGKKSTMFLMLTSLSVVGKRFTSPRCYNDFTWKAGSGIWWKSEGNSRKREKRRSSQPITPPVVVTVWLSDLLTISGCTPSERTRWWDGMKERRREGRRPIWMSESEGIRFLGLIDNDIPAWAVR